MNAARKFLITGALFIGLSGFTSHAALIDNGDGTITDTSSGLMWLQDANRAMGRFDADGADDGLMHSFYFGDFVAQMNAGNITGGNFGYTDWRLPTTLQPDPTCSNQSGGSSFGTDCTGSEMGYLYYVSLGNTAGGPLVSTGTFLNLQSGFYWSSTQTDLINPNVVWGFDFSNGYQQQGNLLGYGLLVRNANALPEPGSLALLVSVLMTLAATSRTDKSARLE